MPGRLLSILLIRQTAELSAERDTLKSGLEAMQKKETTRVVHDHIRKAAREAKLRDTAVEDALVLGERIFTVDESGSVVARDGVGVTPGVGPDVWLTDVKATRPHWWPESSGAGARGNSGASGGGVNPFSKDGWNMTAQGQAYRDDPNKAAQLAAAAGTTIGGPKPV